MIDSVRDLPPVLLLVAACSGAPPDLPPAAAAPEDAAHPPIDCPLRKRGVDPDGLEPFERTAEYVRFLERPDRALWQKPEAVVAALGLEGTETVADVGAGSGYFTFRIARLLAAGKVVAIDVQPEMVRHLHHRARTEGVGNVAVVLADPGDPALPGDADLVFLCDVLHHVPERAAWLGRLVAQMRPGARLVLIEFRDGELPEGPPESIKIPRAELVQLATAAGLVVEAERPDLLPYQDFLVFRKP